MTDDRPRLSRRALVGSLAAGVVGTAGCSSLPGIGGSNSVDPVWRRSFDGAWGASPPAVAEGAVLVGNQAKALHALDPADGTTAFAVETGGPIQQRPAVPEAGGPYHVHSTDGDLYTVGTSGDRLWTHEGQAARGVVGRAGSLLVADDPGTESVRGLDPVTGDQRFRLPGTPYHYPGLTADVFAMAVPTGEGGAELLVSNHDGSVRWRRPLEWSPNPVVAGDSLFLGMDPTVTAHALDDGGVRWRNDVGGEGRPIQDLTVGEDVYVQRELEDSVELLALDRGTGRVRWRRSPGGYWPGRVVPTDDAVYVAVAVDDPDGGALARVERYGLDGTRDWERTTDLAVGGRVDGAVRVGELFCVRNDRSLLALDAETGESLWRFENDGSRLGVDSHDGALYASLLGAGAVARLPTD